MERNYKQCILLTGLKHHKQILKLLQMQLTQQAFETFKVEGCTLINSQQLYWLLTNQANTKHAIIDCEDRTCELIWWEEINPNDLEAIENDVSWYAISDDDYYKMPAEFKKLSNETV